MSILVVCHFSYRSGHAFCYSCIYEWLSHDIICPSCRAPLPHHPYPCHLISTQVDHALEKYPDERVSQRLIDEKAKFKEIKHPWDSYFDDHDVCPHARMHYHVFNSIVHREMMLDTDYFSDSNESRDEDSDMDSESL